MYWLAIIRQMFYSNVGIGTMFCCGVLFGQWKNNERKNIRGSNIILCRVMRRVYFDGFAWTKRKCDIRYTTLTIIVMIVMDVVNRPHRQDTPQTRAREHVHFGSHGNWLRIYGLIHKLYMLLDAFIFEFMDCPSCIYQPKIHIQSLAPNCLHSARAFYILQNVIAIIHCIALAHVWQQRHTSVQICRIHFRIDGREKNNIKSPTRNNEKKPQY